MKIKGRTHHMLVSLWGKRWKEVSMCFFTAYIDDSGTDPAQKVAVASALIVPAGRIVSLENEWDRLKKKEHFSCFHMAEFSSPTPNEDSDFFGWSKEKHDRVFLRVRQICKKYFVRAFSFTVNKQDYDEVITEDFRRHSGLYHYTWAIRHVLAQLPNWRRAVGIEYPLEYVFSWMGDKRNNERRRELENVLDQAQDDAQHKGFVGEFDNWSLRRPKELPGLQCSDLVAWMIYQYGLYAFYKKPLVPDAMTAIDDFGKHMNGTWGVDATVTRNALEKWRDAEKKLGVSMQRFQQWEQKKRAANYGKDERRIRKVRQHDAAVNQGTAQPDTGCVRRGEADKSKKAEV